MSETPIRDGLNQRLQAVEQRIERATARAGRPRSSVTLIAVTKTFPAEMILEAYALGLRDFGENYVQEFERKKPLLASLGDARFHLIGHLQTNKARIAAELFGVVQTVDSEKLARRLDEAREQPLEIMIEVKLSDEDSKYGAAPESLPALIAAVRNCPRLQLSGLMTMPPWNDDPEQTRPYFRRLAQLAREHGLQNLSPNLSMGMSHDFEVAIEEGATHIRVGRALFGPRPKRADLNED